MERRSEKIKAFKDKWLIKLSYITTKTKKSLPMENGDFLNMISHLSLGVALNDHGIGTISQETTLSAMSSRRNLGQREGPQVGVDCFLLCIAGSREWSVVNILALRMFTP